jgi:hypothetical protein
MANFANSFWSSDYAGGTVIEYSNLIDAYIETGLGVLFGKLQQGVQENQQVLTIARMRADAEDSYGQRLGDIIPASDRVSGGFTRDDGASVRKVSTPQAYKLE